MTTVLRETHITVSRSSRLSREHSRERTLTPFRHALHDSQIDAKEGQCTSSGFQSSLKKKVLYK